MRRCFFEDLAQWNERTIVVIHDILNWLDNTFYTRYSDDVALSNKLDVCAT